MNRKRVAKKEFGELFKKGEKIYNRYFVIYYKNYSFDITKVSIKKKVGNSVNRNYHKRLFRSAIQLIKKENFFLKEKLVLVIILKKINFNFDETFELLYSSFRKIYR